VEEEEEGEERNRADGRRRVTESKGLKRTIESHLRKRLVRHILSSRRRPSGDTEQVFAERPIILISCPLRDQDPRERGKKEAALLQD
jgi:hypothetical protein